MPGSSVGSPGGAVVGLAAAIGGAEVEANEPGGEAMPGAGSGLAAAIAVAAAAPAPVGILLIASVVGLPVGVRRFVLR
ncbi:MAG: hypothetical protein H0T59_02440 [Chloroflexi bacterium]|nr:hypothetical protein [Chloroflexota bacterium]